MGLVLFTIAGFAVTAGMAIQAAMVALSIAMTLAAKKASAPNMGRSQAEIKQTLRSSTAPEDWIYGHAVKGGLLAFAEEEVGGWQDENTNPEENQGFVELLHQVFVMAAHPVDRIGRIWLNDDEIQTFGGNATYELMNNPSTVNQFMLQNCPSWKSDMIGRGLTSLRLSMLFNQKKFPSGIPNVKMEIWGRRIYDPRDGQTKWSDNAALILLDFIRNHQKMRLKDHRIDWESFKSAATVCDEIVTTPEGQLEKRYTINGVFDLGERPSSIMNDMLKSMAGELTWFGGRMGVMAGAYYGPATYTVPSSDILGDIQITPESAAKERINTINGTFVDPEQLYVETDFPPVIVNEWVTEDGEERTEDMKLRFVTSHYQAQRLANIQLRRNRLGRTIKFDMNLRGYHIRPGSCIMLDVPEIALRQEMRVVEWEHDPISAKVTLTVRQDGIEVWDDAIGKVMERPPLVNLPSGGPAVPSDIKFQVETIGEVVQGLLTWRNSAMTAYTNINIKRGGNTVYTVQEPRNIHRIHGLAAGDYVAELRAVSVAGGMSDAGVLSFVVATPPAVVGVDIRAGNWDVTLTPRIATQSAYGADFEFFYYREPLQIAQVESTAQRLGYGAQLTHSGLATGTVHYYWIRAINAYGKGPLFALQASTTRDADSVLDVIAGEIGADALKDELKAEIEKIPVIDTAVKTETTARRDADKALGQRIDTVTATTSSNSAAIQSEATARASADEAIGKRVDTVQAIAGSNTAAIQTTATAGTTNDGKTMNAMWSTRASINDVVGGFGLMAEKDPDGATRIKFLVDADIFAVLGRNGDKRAPFVIKDGVVYMNKLLLDDAEIGSVIAKYINVQDLDAVTITASTIKSSDNGASFSLLPDGTLVATKATISGAITATSGSFTGTVNANAGTFNNVTIAENCNVLGTVYADRIVGDIVAIKRLLFTPPRGTGWQDYCSFWITPANMDRVVSRYNFDVGNVQFRVFNDGVIVQNVSGAGSPFSFLIRSGANRVVIQRLSDVASSDPNFFADTMIYKYANTDINQ